MGKSLVPLLVENGYRVRLLVRPESEFDWLPEEHVAIVKGDVTDAHGLKNALHGCRYLVHAAAHFRFWGEEDRFFRVNVEGTKNIVKAVLENGIERMIYISSIAVVGKPRPRVLIDEEAECLPQTPYQRTKYQTEGWLLTQAREAGLPVLVLRPGAFYGPGSRYGFNRLFVIEAMKGWRIKVQGGKRLIFPAYVPDVAKSVAAALKTGRVGEIYNSCDHPYSHNQGNTVASRMLGIGTWRWNAPKALMLSLAWLMEQAARISGREPFYPLNLRHYVFNDWNVSSQKAAEELGFVPTPLEEGLAETVHWLRAQEDLG